MREVRNSDGRLVCRLNETSGTVEIKIKNRITLIFRTPDGKTKIINK